MLIIRIEDPSGAGCYSGRFASNGAERAHRLGDCPLSERHHPEPYRDEGLEDTFSDIEGGTHASITTEGSRFGFNSRQQFHAWFYTSRSREILREMSFVASIYTVPDQYVEEGECQAVFEIAHAQLLQRISCDAPDFEIDAIFREHFVSA